MCPATEQRIQSTAVWASGIIHGTINPLLGLKLIIVPFGNYNPAWD
jgi:hypothetical protein